MLSHPSPKSGYRLSMLALCMATALCWPAQASAGVGDNPRVIDRASYATRLRALWLGQCVANWTGLRTEGRTVSPPFLTDADWGTSPYPSAPWVTLDLYLWGNPWGADDDTDIEYVYLHVLHTQSANRLTPVSIAQNWIGHINSSIWVSNLAARNLISAGVRPPMTALAQGLDPAAPADQSLMIDAQLTTELFGVLCPGMPERALDMADLPIRTTARGHSAHAAQFYVVLYSLASQIDHAQSGRDQVIWLVREARKYLPDSSKAADVIDFVLADFLANPDINDWERTRDLVAARYQTNAAENGFVYRAWYESSVNLAGGLIALLYGQMNFERTVQIGTLSGWDSDNGTATMGALVAFVTAPSFLSTYSWLSNNYWITRTRDDLPDYTPASTTDGEDTFTLMAQRMLPIADREVLAAGGRVHLGPAAVDGTWLLPPGGAGDGITKSLALSRSPSRREFLRSANWSVRLAGGSVSASISVPGAPEPGFGSAAPVIICDGQESDTRGLEEFGAPRAFCSTQRAGGNPASTEQSLSVAYDRPVSVHTVRFIGGRHYSAGPVQGGWFTSLRVEALLDGNWTPQPIASAAPPLPTEPFAMRDFVLVAPIQATGIRLVGLPGGLQAFVTCMELDALAPPAPEDTPTFDLTHDNHLNIDDLYAWHAAPIDLNADGLANEQDHALLECAIRWNELPAMSAH